MSGATRGGQSPHWVVPFLGALSDLPQSVLPSKTEVIRGFYYRHEQQLKNTETIANSVKANELKNQIIDELTADIECLWTKADLPVKTSKYVRYDIKTLLEHKKLSDIRKHGQRHLNDTTYIESAKKVFGGLLDLSPCRCYAKTLLDQWQNVECQCPLLRKIPDVEFYIDQRDLVRKFAIGAGPSHKANKRQAELEEKEELKQKKAQQAQSRLDKYQKEKSASINQDTYDSDRSDDHSEMEINPINTNDTDYAPAEKKARKKRCIFSTARRTHHRYRHSENSSVACINSVLVDLKKHMLETGENFLDIVDDLMVDRTSIRNWNKSDRVNYIAQHSETNTNLECIKFDGKISKTLISPNVFKKQDNITIISEPGGKYLDHISPENGTAPAIVKDLVPVIKATNSEKSMKAIGADGTAVNTGHLGGVIKLLEDALGFSLQWVICLLHCNELQMKALIKFLDGETSSGNTWKGEVMMEVMACQTDGFRQVITYKKIKGKVPKDLPEEFVKGLSSEQEYFYLICLAVQSGEFPESLKNRKHGNIHQARWVNTTSGILLLYCTTARPSDTLKRLSKIIVNVYAPNFFQIKTNWHVSKAAPTFYFMYDMARKCCNTNELEVYKKSLEINCYSIHPESILLAMVFDDDLAVRKKAIKDYILKCDKNEKRNFRKPSINWKARSYMDLVDFKDNPVSMPPLLRDISLEEFEDCYLLGTDLSIPAIQHHSQNCERAVADTSAAVESAIGHENQKALIIETNKSRQEIPTRSTKSIFLDL